MSERASKSHLVRRRFKHPTSDSSVQFATKYFVNETQDTYQYVGYGPTTSSLHRLALASHYLRLNAFLSALRAVVSQAACAPSLLCIRT